MRDSDPRKTVGIRTDRVERPDRPERQVTELSRGASAGVMVVGALMAVAGGSSEVGQLEVLSEPPEQLEVLSLESEPTEDVIARIPDSHLGKKGQREVVADRIEKQGDSELRSIGRESKSIPH